jgi:hypothetical protein
MCLSGFSNKITHKIILKRHKYSEIRKARQNELEAWKHVFSSTFTASGRDALETWKQENCFNNYIIFQSMLPLSLEMKHCAKRLPHNSSPVANKVHCYFRKLIGYVKSYTRLKKCYFLFLRSVFIRSRRKFKCSKKLTSLQRLSGEYLQKRDDYLRHIPTPAPWANNKFIRAEFSQNITFRNFSKLC